MATSLFPKVINQFNKKHASKANGICNSGASIAGIVLTPLTVELLKTYGMPGTLLNLSAIMLNTIPAVILLRNQNSRNGKDNQNKTPDFKLGENSEEKELFQKHIDQDTSKVLCPTKPYTITETELLNNKILGDTSLNPRVTDISIPLENTIINATTSPGQINNFSPENKKQNCLQTFSIFWDPLFLTFSFVRCFGIVLFVIVPTIIVDFSIDKEVPKNQTSYVLIAYAVASLIAKLGLGWITDGNYISRIKYIFLWYIVEAFAFGLMVLSNGLLIMATGVLLISTSNSTIFPNLVVLISEHFEKDKQSMAMTSHGLFLLPIWFVMPLLIGKGYFTYC